CAAGLLPFGAASRQSVLAAQKKGAQPIQELCPELPKALSAAIMCAIDPDEEMRPASAGEFLMLAFPDYRPAQNRSSRARWMVPAAGALVGAILAAVAFWPFGGAPQNPSQPLGPRVGDQDSAATGSGADSASSSGRGDSPAA